MDIKKIIRINTDYKNKDVTPKNILIIGVFHGDEPQGEYFINEYLSQKTKESTLKNNVYYIPRLNDNNERTNKNGVDINRNFPTGNWEKGIKDKFYGGDYANSEPETRFIVALMDEVEFDAVITIHAPYKIINYDGDAKGKAQTLAKKISFITGYPVQKDIGYETPGSFGTFSGIERDIPTITIEVDEEIEPKELLPNFIKLFDYLEDVY